MSTLSVGKDSVATLSNLVLQCIRLRQLPFINYFVSVENRLEAVGYSSSI